MSVTETDKYSEQIDEAWKEYESSNLDAAKMICEKIAVEFPNKITVFFLLGHIYSQAKKHSEALKQYLIALDNDKEEKLCGFIYYWIGLIYNEFDFLGPTNPLYDSNKAREYFHKGIDYENYPLDLILQLERLISNDYEKIKLHEKAIKKFPEEISLYIKLSRVYKRLNNPEREEKVLNDAIEKGLKNASLYFNVGDCYYYKNKFSRSREFYLEALNLNDHYPNNNFAIKCSIANSYYKENDFENAEIYYKQSFEESINTGDCWFGFFGFVLTIKGHNKNREIENLINELIINESIYFNGTLEGFSNFKLDSEITDGLVFVEDLKKISSAFKSLKFTNKHDIFLGKFWLIRAMLAGSLNNYLEKLNSIKNTLKYISPYQYEFLYKELCGAYAELFSMENERTQNINLIVNSFISDLTTNKYSKLFYKEATEVLTTVINGLFESKLYERVVEVSYFFNDEQIGESNVGFSVAYSLTEIKKYDEAKVAYNKLIEKGYNSSSILNNLGHIYKTEGNLTKAVEFFKRALELDPNDKIPKRNLLNASKELEDLENERKKKKALEAQFKLALKSLKDENNFVLEKLHRFINNVKKDEKFKDWTTPIQKYKFPMLMETDKQKAESLKVQWLSKNYIIDSENRDEHNVVIYYINPYIESEIKGVNNNKIPENWINGFSNVSLKRLDEIGYFYLVKNIRKVNKKYKPLLERDFNELVFNYIVQNEKATIVLSGSLVELVLTYYCEKKRILHVPYLDSKGNPKTKKLYDCVLNDLIQYAEKNLLFGSDFPHLSNLSRIYRNFIHPGRELKDKLDKHKCDLCFISTTEILRRVL